MNAQPILNVSNLSVYYGKVQGLAGISLEVFTGEVVSVIGSNGAGKTTLLKAVSGLIPFQTGAIDFNGKSIRNLPPHEITKLGIIQVPEGRQILAEMTVRENLEMGAYLEKDGKKVKDRFQVVFHIFPVIQNRLNQGGGSMSGGEQQMLAIARALMADPELLMLDEPSLGLAPLMVKEVFKVIKEINQRGKTILLVEQSANLALKVAQRGFILETGKVALGGRTSDLLTQEQVRKIYLGEE
jgi:branched-chain amino acid transport system ATP-binding protein